MEDLSDLYSARIVINFTEHPGPVDTPSRGGKDVEFGIALALAIEAVNAGAEYRVCIVGPRRNVFHCLGIVEQYDTWPECLAALQRTVER